MPGAVDRWSLRVLARIGLNPHALSGYKGGCVGSAAWELSCTVVCGFLSPFVVAANGLRFVIY
jgi:hypothetical protein